MQEYVTPALVLDRETTGENDSRVFLFTKVLGRVTARAKSSRKVNSKLGGHLEPLTLVQVRLVEKSGFQIVDALSSFSKGGWSLGDGGFQKSLPASRYSLLQRENIQILQMIKKMIEPGHPDPELWNLIVSGQLVSRQFLKVMGFDPEHAICNSCERPRPSYFLISDAFYRCKECINNTREAVWMSN